jgi:anti-sigma B factor antagonist
MDLTANVAELGKWVVIAIGGEVDLATAPTLRSKLVALAAEYPGSPIAVDLGGVSFIDSSGLGVLIGARRRAVENGGTLVLVGLLPPVARLLAITGLDSVFDVFDSREALDG